MSPAISVVMCAYNAAPYIEAAVRSILDQTLRDFELLLFDDGSTDATPRILQQLAHEDGRIRLHLRKHGNFCDHLNEGLGLARGKYIARADADDLNEPRRFEAQVTFLKQHPEVVALSSRVTETDPYGVELRVTGEADQPLRHVDIERALLAGNGWAISQPAAMIRTSAVRQVGGYRPQFLFAEDPDLFLRLAEVGQLANLPEPLVRYRRHARSVNQVRAGAQRAVYRQVLEEAHARRGLEMPQEPEHFRTEPPPVTQRLEQWTWNALRARRADAARRHALHYLRLRPFSPHSYKLLLCAVRGR